jgi:hypothetical protein
MKKTIIFWLLVAALIYAATANAQPIPPSLGGLGCSNPDTIANLPAHAAGRLCLVSDGATDQDCSSGSGSTAVLCRSDGSTWSAYPGNTTIDGVTLTVDADNTGTEPADGAGFCIEGGTGSDSCWTYNQASGQTEITGLVNIEQIRSPDNAVAPGNAFQIHDNDTDFTPNPSCSTICAAGFGCIGDLDESASDEFHFCGGTSSLLNLTTGALASLPQECYTFYADEGDCNTTNGCAVGSTAGTNFDYETLDFAAAADDTGSFVWPCNKNMDFTNSTFEILWTSDHANCDGGATRDVCWVVDTLVLDDDEVLETAAMAGAGGAVTDRCTADGDLMVTSAAVLGWDQTALTDDGLCVVTLTRDVDGGGCGAATDDDYDQDADVVGVRFCYDKNNLHTGE